LYIRVCLSLLGGLALAWPAAAQSPRRAGSAGVTLALPAGWHSTRPVQGNITNPLTRLAVSSGPIRPRLTGACDAQVADYTFPATAVVIVVVEWTRPLGGPTPPRPRPRRFTAANLPIHPPPGIECFEGPGGAIEFAARRHTFAAYVMLGRKAPARLADRARAVLDTLRIAPR
jgi:hypothetical protein